MTVEQILLTVLTVAVVCLIVLVVAVLVVARQALRRVKRAGEELQAMAAKGSSAAGRVAPWGAAAMAAVQVARIINKIRR